ncbi:MAG: hypothetical protein QM765_30575 [Myxococcales bacterium]
MLGPVANEARLSSRLKARLDQLGVSRRRDGSVQFGVPELAASRGIDPGSWRLVTYVTGQPASITWVKASAASPPPRKQCPLRRHRQSVRRVAPFRLPIQKLAAPGSREAGAEGALGQLLARRLGRVRVRDGDSWTSNEARGSAKIRALWGDGDHGLYAVGDEDLVLTLEPTGL